MRLNHFVESGSYSLALNIEVWARADANLCENMFMTYQTSTTISSEKAHSLA